MAKAIHAFKGTQQHATVQSIMKIDMDEQMIRKRAGQDQVVQKNLNQIEIPLDRVYSAILDNIDSNNLAELNLALQLEQVQTTGLVHSVVRQLE